MLKKLLFSALICLGLFSNLSAQDDDISWEDLEELESALLEVAAADQLSLILVKAGIAPVGGIPRVSHLPEQIRDRFRVAAQA